MKRRGTKEKLGLPPYSCLSCRVTQINEKAFLRTGKRKKDAAVASGGVSEKGKNLHLYRSRKVVYLDVIKPPLPHRNAFLPLSSASQLATESYSFEGRRIDCEDERFV